MKGHKKLIGTSRLADNSEKHDYLSACEISLGPFTKQFVVRVVDDEEPLLLGLDVIIGFGMMNSFHFHTSNDIF